MLESIRQLRTTTRNVRREMKIAADSIGEFLVDVFHFVALFAIGATTVWSAVGAFLRMAAQGGATLTDILLLFIYLEIGAMVGIYFKTKLFPVPYLIYIAITALCRVLVEVVGAEQRTGIDILIVTGAIVLLAFASLVLKFASQKSRSESEHLPVPHAPRMNQSERAPI